MNGILDESSMIAGKTPSEILSMNMYKRYRWYKIILPEDKTEAMRIVETRRRAKISMALTGKIFTEKHKANLSVAQTDMIRSEETRVKMSAGLIERWKDPEFRAKQSGENNPNFGSTRTEKTKAKMRASAIDHWGDPENRAKISGENNSNWQGGISFEPYSPEFNAELKRQIRHRDSYTCQECQHTEDQLGYSLAVHHIDYDKKNNSPENLISLCRSCHSQTNFGREDWTEYFGKIIGG